MVIKADKIKCYLVILITFILHLILINFYPVNFEYTFSEGSKYLLNYDIKIVENYFLDQANTFAYSLLAGLINKIFLLENPIIYTRLLSASSYFFFGIAFINLFNYFKVKLKCYYFLIFFFLNPIIWTYGYRGIPDLFSTSLGLYSFSEILFLKGYNNPKKIFNYFLLSVAICIKPFSLIYLGIIIFFEYKNNFIFLLNKYLIIIILVLFLPVLYFLIIKNNFDFYLIHPRHENELKFVFKNVFYNFSGYLIFISILFFPFAANLKFLNYKRNPKKFFLLLIISIFYISIYYSSNAIQFGELNFGFLSQIIDKNIIFIFYFISFFILLLYLTNIKGNFLNYKLLFIIFIYIFILALTRPVQRYLINIYPIIFLFLILNFNIFKINKLLFYAITIFYIFINLLITVNFYNVSSDNKNIITFLRSEGIIEKTLPGVLYVHSKHFFDNYLDDKEYIVSFNPGNTVIKYFDFKHFLHNKVYYINKL